MVDSGTDDTLVKLGEAARLAGVTVQQLQYYLMVGVVQPSALSRGRQRLFGSEQIRQIRLVKLLNASGYPLREIREIFIARAQAAGAVEEPP